AARTNPGRLDSGYGPLSPSAAGQGEAVFHSSLQLTVGMPSENQEIVADEVPQVVGRVGGRLELQAAAGSPQGKADQPSAVGQLGMEPAVVLHEVAAP